MAIVGVRQNRFQCRGERRTISPIFWIGRHYLLQFIDYLLASVAKIYPSLRIQAQDVKGVL